MSVDILSPFYDNETGTNCHTGNFADTTDNRNMTNWEKTIKKPEAEVLDSRSRLISIVHQPNRLGFGFVN